MDQLGYYGFADIDEVCGIANVFLLESEVVTHGAGRRNGSRHNQASNRGAVSSRVSINVDMARRTRALNQ